MTAHHNYSARRSRAKGIGAEGRYAESVLTMRRDGLSSIRMEAIRHPGNRHLLLLRLVPPHGGPNLLLERPALRSANPRQAAWSGAIDMWARHQSAHDHDRAEVFWAMSEALRRTTRTKFLAQLERQRDKGRA